MMGHVSSKYQDYHVLGVDRKAGNGVEGGTVLTPLTSLNSSGDRFMKMLHSGELRILNETAQWWFSSGDILMYLGDRCSYEWIVYEQCGHRTARLVLALIW